MKGDIKKTLLDIGFSDKAAQIYIYLGKRGPQKGGTIARQLKINKGQVYRTLKTLQKNGVVESTLEYPAKFVAVPLESVIDSFIKSKREEVDHIEETKKDLVNDWNKIRQIEVDSSLEKFSVIEGEKTVFHKISQMIQEAKKELLTIVSVNALLKADQYGIFEDIKDHPLKKQIKFRFLTQLTKNDLKTLKIVLKKIEPDLDFKGKDPNIDASICPRMVIKDKDEILLFISDTTDKSSKNKIEAVLCTNCQSIINSFYGVFQDLWRDSTDIEDVIVEVETGKSPQKTTLIKDPVSARNLYCRELGSAKEDILIVTSSNGLFELVKEKPRLLEWNGKGVNIRIMAPIIGSNLGIVKELSGLGEVRHVPRGYLETIIIDRQHLFHFKDAIQNEQHSVNRNFENTYYSNDQEYVEKNANMLEDIWINAFSPSPITLESITRLDKAQSNAESEMIDETKKIEGNLVRDAKNQKQLTEKTLLNKFINNKRVPVADFSKDLVIHYANAGQAVIHPPEDFNIPDLLFHILHMDKKSSFGIEDAMIILSRQKTPKGYLYFPASFITDNEEASGFWEKFFEGYPLKHILVNENEFHIQVQNNILFAGWTIPIPLLSHNQDLPPSSILIEGYGKVKTVKYAVDNPSGYTNVNEVNYLDAFVTYTHPKSQYNGPGTDGYFFREFFATVYPPQTPRME